MKLNLKHLNSIKTTLEAIEDINRSLEWYEKDLPGPAYMSVGAPVDTYARRDFEHYQTVHFQVSREQFRRIMNERKQELIQNLEDRFEGLEYDPNANWEGNQ